MLNKKFIKILQTRIVQSACNTNLHTTRVLQQCNAYTQVQEKDGVREIRLIEPKSLNSLSVNMMDSLHKEILHDKDNKELRSIVLSAEGKVWSGGHNLIELQNGTPELRKQIFDKLTQIIFDIRAHPVPVIAKIDGLVAAGGLQLISSCDLVICTEKSRFVLPAIKNGIYPHTPVVALTRVIPRQLAAYLSFIAKPINAQEALTAGLVTKVAKETELDQEVEALTSAIIANSRAVVAFGKEFFYKQLELDLKQAYDIASQYMVDNLAMPDGQEGVQSFIEKRKPKWSH